MSLPLYDAPLTPKQILAEAQRHPTGGALSHEIATAHSRCEPRRSSELRGLRKRVVGRIRADLSRYREAVRIQHGIIPVDDDFWCPRVSVDLTQKHLRSSFSELIWIDKLLQYQPDLFEC